MIVRGAHVADFVADRVGSVIVPPFEAIGIERDGALVGGAVFNHWTGSDIHVTVAGSPIAWSRRFLRQLARYAYDQLGCERVTIVTEQPSVLDFAERLGGVVEGRMRNHFGPGRNAALIGILKSDWKIAW